MTISRTTHRAVLAAVLSIACAAQEPQPEALSHGQLTVWILTASAPRTNLQAINDLHHATPLTYQETNAGSFGQNAASFGQNSGSYGAPSDTSTISTPKAATDGAAQTTTPNGSSYRQQTAGTFGQNASTAGANAAAYGQTSGSFGQNAGSFGTNSAGYGTAASTLGQNASNGPANAQRPIPRSSLSLAFEARLKTAFPQLQLRFFDVPASELKDWLTVAANTQNYPDVLLGSLPSNWPPELKHRLLVDMVQPAALYDDGIPDPNPQPSDPIVTILSRAPHPAAARALILWLDEAALRCEGCTPPSETATRQPYAGVALSAVSALLQSKPLGDLADPDMATFDPQLASRMLATSASTAADPTAAGAEVLRASANGRLAMVSLRVLASSDAAFGAAHPLVILRQQPDNQWRVLHISLNLPAAQTEPLRRALMDTTPSADAERVAGVAGVTLASPPDNDTRTPTPDLTWDNKGGAGLQVVEWQQSLYTRWSDPHLYLVPDQAARLKTQVTAAFATYPTRYRWRVWSVGAQGQTKITPWRTMNIVR